MPNTPPLLLIVMCVQLQLMPIYLFSLFVLYVMLNTNHCPSLCRDLSVKNDRSRSFLGDSVALGWLCVHMYSTTGCDSTVVVWLARALTSVHNLYSIAPGLWPIRSQEICYRHDAHTATHRARWPSLKKNWKERKQKTRVYFSNMWVSLK